MANFEVVEQEGLKMIKATINGETVRAEAGALHYMQGSIEMESKLPGAKGFLKAMVSSESITKPTYKGTGTIFFGPPIFGEYMVLELSGETWILDKGAYVCSDESITVDVFRNKAMSGLASGEGFYQTKVEGTGQVVIQAQGPLQAIDLVDDRLVVDGSFAVAREGQLKFSVQKATKSLIGSMTSGEGLVNVIEGTGRVYLAPVPNKYLNLIESLHALIPMPSS